MTSTAATGGSTSGDAALLQALQWRPVGPFRGGRVVAVAGDPAQPQVFYFGSTGGGVWKTEDGGVSWRNVSDGFFGTASIGAIGVADSDPNVIYAGSGETTIRGNVSHGDGIYKSTDGGRSWAHMGLAATRHIAKVRIDPRNPDLVYVAALGHAFGPNEERGVFRSRDGGRTWEQVLSRGNSAGAIDLSLDPHNPRILYAAFWDAQRLPHTMRSGGPGSGLFRSTDGGDTWTDLSHKPGLPKGDTGKIGVAVSPARSGRIWALIEAKESGLFRSDDGGETWERTSDERELYQRPWYYMHLIADPLDAETLYVPNLRLWKSIDGGKTFSGIPTAHGDNHDLWIDPRDNRRMIESNDGGACVSFDAGTSWSTIYNQPTAEFYHVVTDNEANYRLYGAQQDNSTLSVASRSDDGAITWNDCYPVGGGESGYIAVRPDDPTIVYAGSYGGLLTRYDHRTHQHRNISVWPDNPIGWAAKDLKYRFQWTAPIVLSPHDPNTLYTAGNHLFRTHDEGTSWEQISPDLTRNDPSKMESSGGPFTQDNTSVEYYGTIFAFAESPVQRGVLWCGSDDGLVHVSRDDGQSWQQVTPKALPAWALISIIEASPHDAGTAYVAATRYKHDDTHPYLYKTNDFGQSWQAITAGIPNDDYTRCIREDPKRRGLLYAGTERGLSVSLDDGASWQSFRQNLPIVPIHDLAIHNDDLIAATHGRGFWILDDLTPLHQLVDGLAQRSAHLFSPRPVTRLRSTGRRPRPDKGVQRNFQSVGGAMVQTLQRRGADGEPEVTLLDAGKNPPEGVVVTYYLKEQTESEVTLTFLDAEGKEIKRFSSKKREETPQRDTLTEGEFEGDESETQKQEPRVPARAGTNRFVWNLHYADAENVPGAVLWAGGIEGPLAPPGHYQVRLAVGDQSLSETFELRPDPRMRATVAGLEEQFVLLIKIRDRLSEDHAAVNQIRDIRTQIDGWLRRTRGQAGAERIAETAKGLKQQLDTIEELLISVRSKAQEDVLNYPIRINNKLAALSGVVGAGDHAPTRQSSAVFDDLSAQLDEALARLRTVIDVDLATLSRALQDASVPAIVLPSTGAVAQPVG